MRLRRILECQLKTLTHANISVDGSTIRTTLNKNGVHGRTPRKKPLLSKINIAARLKSAKVHLDVPQRYWQNILWTDETTVELFGRKTQQHVWGKKAQHTNIRQSVCQLKITVFSNCLHKFLKLSPFFQNSTHNSQNCTHKMLNASHLLQNVTLHSK